MFLWIALTAPGCPRGMIELGTAFENCPFAAENTARNLPWLSTIGQPHPALAKLIWMGWHFR